MYIVLTVIHSMLVINYIMLTVIPSKLKINYIMFTVIPSKLVITYMLTVTHGKASEYVHRADSDSQ